MTDTTASRRFIGLALLDPHAAIESALHHGMTADWLAGPAYREAWDVIRSLFDQGKPIDCHFVVDAAKARLGQATLVTEEFVRECDAAACTARGGADALLDILRREYTRRELDAIASSLSNQDADPIDLAATTASRLITLADATPTKRDDPDILEKEIEREWRNAANGVYPGLTMPWPTVYSRCGGPDKRTVTLLVGHGNAGKSSLMLQWAIHIAQKGGSVLVFSLEDSAATAYKRMAGMVSGVNILSLRLGLCSMFDIERALEGLKQVRQLPIRVISSRMSIGDMAIAAQRENAKGQLSAIFIDAFKDIPLETGGVEGENYIMGKVVTMAHRLNVPIVMSHHVRKSPATLKGQNPYHAWNIEAQDLRGSSRLWDDARMVIILQQYPTTEQPVGADEFTYQLHVAKANHGISGVRVAVERDTTLRWFESNKS